MLRAAWPHADYLMLNLIGPTSAPLLSQSTRLRHLLASLVDEQRQLNQDGRRRVPLLAKLRCMPERTPFSIAGLLVELGFDGLLAAHDPATGNSRALPGLAGSPAAGSGRQQIEELRRFCGPDMLCFGGVQTADHLRARMSAGAELVQVHTAFMHQSPGSHAGCCGSASFRQKRQRPEPVGALSWNAGKASQLASHSFDQKRSIFASACSF